MFSTRFCDFEETDTWCSLPVQLIRASQPSHIPISRCFRMPPSAGQKKIEVNFTSSVGGEIPKVPSKNGYASKTICSPEESLAPKEIPVGPRSNYASEVEEREPHPQKNSPVIHARSGSMVFCGFATRGLLRSR